MFAAPVIQPEPVIAASVQEAPANDPFNFDAPSSAPATGAPSDPFENQFSSLNLDSKEPEPAFDFGISTDPPKSEPTNDMFA